MNTIITLLDNSEITVPSDTVAEIERPMGDIVTLYDYCSEITGFYCPDCLEAGRVIHCGKRFVSGTVRGEPEAIRVTLKDGQVLLAKKWVRLPPRLLT